MTELFELYKADREGAKEKIRNMDTSRLLAELDDTLQIDVLRMSHLDWMKLPNMQLYRALLAELGDRCRRDGCA